ncbi:MAG TPA: metalloregulator ArsR/SmtB family transcription factor [Ktedonobacterales bacterium]|nr:metalloregulator ArsR/SmtB family transcription factor [Ktedonobacterales bacterium]
MTKHDEDEPIARASEETSVVGSMSHEVGGAIETLLSYLKALADQSRLRLLGVLATGPRSVEELATLLDLKAPTVSHHLARLKDLGLVGMRADRNTHVYLLDRGGLERLAKLFGTFSAPTAVAMLAGDTATAPDGAHDLFSEVADPWERKVLRDFFVGERLKEIPAQAKKRMVVIKWLATRFEWERDYSEAEVNAILKRHHDDVAYLRRELIGARLMRREQGHYWRAEPPTPETLDALAQRFAWGRLYTEAEVNAIIGADHRDVTTLRQELIIRETLACEHGKYWLTRPPDDALSEQ